MTNLLNSLIVIITCWSILACSQEQFEQGKLEEVDEATFADIMLLSSHDDIHDISLAAEFLDDESSSDAQELLLGVIEKKVMEMNLYYRNLTSDHSKDAVCRTPKLLRFGETECRLDQIKAICEELAALNTLCKVR